jgi:NADH-quinone oxidoreductase subunit N
MMSGGVHQAFSLAVRQAVPLPGSPAAAGPTFDLHIPWQLTLALGPDVVLFIGTAVLMLWAAWRPDSREHQRNVGRASLALVFVTMAAVVGYDLAHVTAGPGVIAVDAFRWASDLIFLAASAGTIALSIDYNAREGILAAESHVMVLFATSGMMLLAAGRDLMIIFLGIELMSVAVYILAGFNRRSARSAEAALKYFLLGAFSTGFLLYGIALIYGATGSTNLTVIGDRIHNYSLGGTPLVTVGVALILVGFGFKVAAAPFHMWAPDVYEGAPTPITGFMAAAVKAAAFAAFLRVWLEAFGDVVYQWHNAMWFLAILTMLVGNLVALVQRNIKRMLAYSSIAQAGYVLVGVVAGTTLGASAFLFFLASYTLATLGAFAVIVALGDAGETHLDIGDYAGLWTTRPWLAAAMSACMLSLLGFPIFGGIGFLAKWYMLQAALEASYFGEAKPQFELAVMIVITSMISAGYYLRLVTIMFMRPARADGGAAGNAAPRAGQLTRWVVGVSVVLLLALGLAPTYLVGWTASSAPVIANRPSYLLPSSAIPPR